MHNKVKLAYQYLKSQCEINGVELLLRMPKHTDKKNVILVGTVRRSLASIGLTSDGELKCFIKDYARLKWAKEEGFSDEEIAAFLGGEVFREISLVDLGRAFGGIALNKIGLIKKG